MVRKTSTWAFSSKDLRGEKVPATSPPLPTETELIPSKAFFWDRWAGRVNGFGFRRQMVCLSSYSGIFIHIVYVEHLDRNG